MCEPLKRINVQGKISVLNNKTVISINYSFECFLAEIKLVCKFENNLTILKFSNIIFMALTCTFK